MRYSINIFPIVYICFIEVRVWNIIEELLVGNVSVEWITKRIAVIELLLSFEGVVVAFVLLTQLTLPWLVWVDNDVELVRGSLDTTSW